MRKNRKSAPFRFKPFSRKQLKVLTWWMDSSPHKDKDAIICDGSVRAGKTMAMSLSYVMWAMETFDSENFGMAGKTIGSLRRNVITPLKRMLKSRGYKVKEHRDINSLTISRNGRVNEFYLFGGKDERSQDLIQGITLAGMFFDEVALMPESFVNQATARCSVDGSKYWFNCNPEGPFHWFKLEWLDKLEQKNALHLHFTMDDNLSLSERIKQRYINQFSGVFFKRYILGLWVLAEGIVYDMFRDDVHVVDRLPEFQRYFVACDYGTANPCVFLLIGEHQFRDDNRFKRAYYVAKEYYYDSRKVGKQKTDGEYSADFREFLGNIVPTGILIDPSAASFIAQLHKDGIHSIIDADNDVIPGIANVSQSLSNGLLFIHRSCVNLLREFGSYRWDPKAQARGEDKPLKQFDHALDALRYFVRYMCEKLGGSQRLVQTIDGKTFTKGVLGKKF